MEQLHYVDTKMYHWHYLWRAGPGTFLGLKQLVLLWNDCIVLLVD